MVSPQPSTAQSDCPTSFRPADSGGAQEMPGAERTDEPKESRSKRPGITSVLRRSRSNSGTPPESRAHPRQDPRLAMPYNQWGFEIQPTWSWNSLTHTWTSVGGIDPDGQGWFNSFFDRRRNTDPFGFGRSTDPFGPPLSPLGPGIGPGITPPAPILPWWHNTNKILFYNKHEPYYGFTNFSNHPVMYKNKKYPTSEHLFQSFKFTTRPKLAEHIRTCSSRPSVAFSEARRFAPEVQDNWSDEKIKAMETTLYLKFTQHRDLKRQLLGTAEKELIENSDKDSFWGCGPDGNGKNELGKALERLRDRLREERR